MIEGDIDYITENPTAINSVDKMIIKQLFAQMKAMNKTQKRILSALEKNLGIDDSAKKKMDSYTA